MLPAAKRQRAEDGGPRDPRASARAPVAVGPANAHTAAALAAARASASAATALGHASSSVLGSASSVGFSGGQLSASATSAQLTPAAHVALLQRQVAALTEERDGLQAKRAFWRDEATTARQVSQEHVWPG